MGEKINKFVIGVSQLVELGCIIGLAGIGLKRNMDAYNAEIRAISAEINLDVADIKLRAKDIEIEQLKKKIKELENQKEVQA